jgi:hypothetical protein
VGGANYRGDGVGSRAAESADMMAQNYSIQSFLDSAMYRPVYSRLGATVYTGGFDSE